MPSDLHEVKHKEAGEDTSIEGAYFLLHILSWGIVSQDCSSKKTLFLDPKKIETLNVKQKAVNG